MIPLALNEIARVTGGVVTGPPGAGEVIVDGPVVTDSRLAGPGGLYIARRGEHADGHDFVADAAGRGAVAAMTERAIADLPCVVVGDSEVAFGVLARAVVDALPDLEVIAITGSSGKTSTKDLLAQVLSGLGPTVAAEGSYNSEIGVPLTVVKVEPTTRYLVVEMGTRGIGQLSYLTRIAPPDIAVVLNVGSAHLGEFGSREAIAKAKGELVQALSADGVAVLNADDPAVAAMAHLTPARSVLVGRAPGAQVRAVDVRLDAQARAAFRLESDLSGPTERAAVQLGLHGEHHVANALSVAAVALTLGLPLTDVAQALSSATPASRWRMEVHDRADGVRIVNDAYNANPDSVRAALRAVVAMSGGRRTWAVLGAMLELGAGSGEEHAEIGRLAATLGIDRLLVVGEGARAMYDAARVTAGSADPPVYAADARIAYELLIEALRPGDVVLLKSSRDAGLRLLGDRLLGDGLVGAGGEGG